MTKRTYQPNKRKRKKDHGFRKRMQTKSGRNVLKRSRDFTTIYNKSRKVYTRYAIVFVSENKNCMQRFGFVASKKTGNAVQRNRIKRLFREFVKNNKEKFKEGTDYIFVGKAVLKEKLASLKYEDIEKDMLKVIKK